MTIKNKEIKRKIYPKSELILGNLTIILWIFLSALCCALYTPIAAVVFFAATAFLVFYEVGKHCVSCFYCKTCTIGMGKLPELFFGKHDVVNANRRALKLFPFAYLLMSVLPLALAVISLVQEVTFYKVALLVAVIAFSSYTGIVRRKSLLRQN